MLYYLSLLTHTDQLAFFRLFGYLSFRAMAAVVTALVIAFWINPMLIRWLKLKQGKGQPIRSDGPARHILEKAGTPTMGGLLILIPWIGSTLIWASLSNRYVWIVLMVTVAFGLLGFMDDYYKVTKRTSDGLSGRARLVVEFGIAMLATCFNYRWGHPGTISSWMNRIRGWPARSLPYPLLLGLKQRLDMRHRFFRTDVLDRRLGGRALGDLSRHRLLRDSLPPCGDLAGTDLFGRDFPGTDFLSRRFSGCGFLRYRLLCGRLAGCYFLRCWLLQHRLLRR